MIAKQLINSDSIFKTIDHFQKQLPLTSRSQSGWFSIAVQMIDVLRYVLSLSGT